MEARKRILVIEDEAPVRRALRAMLEEAGYAVLEAGNGKEGEKNILLYGPDLVILDLNLPGRRGEEILSFIKKHKPTQEIPVVVLTGFGNISKRLSCMLKGAAGFIQKPYDNVELLKTVKKHIGP